MKKALLFPPLPAVGRCWRGGTAGTRDGEKERNHVGSQPPALGAQHGLRDPSQDPPGVRAGTRAGRLAARVASEQSNNDGEDHEGSRDRVHREEGKRDNEEDEGQALVRLPLEQGPRGKRILELALERPVSGVVFYLI